MKPFADLVFVTATMGTIQVVPVVDMDQVEVHNVKDTVWSIAQDQNTLGELGRSHAKVPGSVAVMFYSFSRPPGAKCS